MSYFGNQTRKYPKAIWPQMIKLRPESVPLYPGHERVSAYFPFGEIAVTDLIEGQLAFLHHVRSYDPGTRLLQRNLCWKIEFLNCCLGSLPKEQLDEISAGINEVVQLGGQPNSWAVRNSKALSRALRHTASLKLGKYLEASIEQLDSATSLRPFNWEPRKFFAFLVANSKGRFQTWIAPVACSFKSSESQRSRDTVACPSRSRTSPRSHTGPGSGAGIYIPRRGEPQLLYESIKSDGLLLRVTPKEWQRHRVAIHLTYAGGSESPGPGTVTRYGANIFFTLSSTSAPSLITVTNFS